MKLDFTNLNPTQCVFVYEFLKDHNGTRSAIAAGYSKNSARKTANRLIRHNKHIRAILADVMQYRVDKLEINPTWVLEELETLYDANIDDFVKIDEKGEPYYDFSKVTREQLSKIDKLEISPTKFGTKISVSMGNKLKILETMGKHTDVEAFKDKVEHTGSITLVFDKEDSNA